MQHPKYQEQPEMTIKWNHIIEAQPENGRSIIQVDKPYKSSEHVDSIGKHYTMGQRNYIQYGKWEELLIAFEQSGLDLPDFWWVYAEDFPFPDKEG